MPKPSKQPNYIWQEATNRDELAQDLAETIAKRLSSVLQLKDQAVIAFSGGSTPKPLFKALLDQNIDWTRIVVTLVDERWVPFDHPLSNASFLIDNLLAKLDQPPKFVSLLNISAAAMNAQLSLTSVLIDYCHQTNSSLANPAPFDVAILGMGTDAHTASFFPDAENVQSLVDENNPNFLASCSSPSSQVDRVTWTLPVLNQANFLALHFTGEDKREVFNQALKGNDAEMMPIRSVMFNAQQPLQVYFSV